jgi:hypothetical protein
MSGKDFTNAVMSLEAGEEFVAGHVTEDIPQVGVYKLLAKKKVDGTIEWAHFVERASGLKENVMRGTVRSRDELNIVIDVVNNNIHKVFGLTLKPAAYETRTLDGRKLSDTAH